MKYRISILLFFALTLSCKEKSDNVGCLQTLKEKNAKEIKRLHQELITTLKQNEERFLEFIETEDSLKNGWEHYKTVIPRDSISDVIMEQRFYEPFAKGNDMSMVLLIRNNRSQYRKMLDSIKLIRKTHMEMVSEDYCTHILAFEMWSMDLDYFDDLRMYAAKYDALFELERCLDY